MYIADTSNNRIRKVTVTTSTPRFASSLESYSLPFSLLTSSSTSPTLVPSTSTPTTSTPRINRSLSSISVGIITTIAGTGTAGSSGDTGQATSAGLNGPYAVDVDASGEQLYI